MAEKILVTVEHLKGKCRFWKEGDKIVLWRNTKTRMLGIDYKLSEGRGACLAGLMSLYPYLLAPLKPGTERLPVNVFGARMLRTNSTEEAASFLESI